jgi:hypothetical protein
MWQKNRASVARTTISFQVFPLQGSTICTVPPLISHIFHVNRNFMARQLQAHKSLIRCIARPG